MTSESIFLNKISTTKYLASTLSLGLCLYLMVKLEDFSLKQIFLGCLCLINIKDLLVGVSEKVTHKEILIKWLGKTYRNLYPTLGQRATKLFFLFLAVLIIAIRIILPIVIYLI